MLLCVHCHSDVGHAEPEALATSTQSTRPSCLMNDTRSPSPIPGLCPRPAGAGVSGRRHRHARGHLGAGHDVRRKQERAQPFVRVVEVSEISTDPEPWGLNWPHQFDGWKSTAGDKFYGGSERPAREQARPAALAASACTRATPSASTTARPAATPTCSTTRASPSASRRSRRPAPACTATPRPPCCTARSASRRWASRGRALAADFNMPAVIRGFEELSTKPYGEVLAMLTPRPDGTPGENEPVFPMPPAAASPGEIAGEDRCPPDHPITGEAHPVSCIDCHDPETMRSASRARASCWASPPWPKRRPVPHLPSIERWRAATAASPTTPTATPRARRCARSSAASATSSTTAPPRTR
jgi:nitrite reductase (cytochrome c-552)